MEELEKIDPKTFKRARAFFPEFDLDDLDDEDDEEDSEEESTKDSTSQELP